MSKSVNEMTRQEKIEYMEGLGFKRVYLRVVGDNPLVELWVDKDGHVLGGEHDVDAFIQTKGAAQ